MADLNFKAQIELLDKMTAPMRSIASQAQRLGRQFGETAQQAKKLQSQQRLIDSFKQQKHALAETSEQAQRSRMRLDQLQQQMRATAHPTAALVRQFEAAGRESHRLNTRLDSQRQHLQQLRGRLSEAGVDTRRLSDHERELARNIERTNQQLGEQRRRMGEVRRLQQQSQQMRDMRGKATSLAVGGAAATYAGARVIQPGLEFESEMSRVQAVTRLDKNSEQYKALEAQARQLGATTQFTQANAAQGQKFLAMAGFTPEAIKTAMPGMLDLALAGDMDLASTADIASNILSGMNLQSSEMTDVADVLTAAFTRANVDVGMLGETMKYAAPGAAGLNISLQEVAAMAGKLGDAGMQGSMGGTALRAIMLRMAAPPKKAAAALDQLGISTTDAAGDLRAMPDILKEVYEQTKSLGNAEQLEIFSAISGVEASNAMKVLVDQAGNGELQKMVTTLQAANGEAANVANTMSDNTMGDWKETTSAIDAFRTMLFDTNGGALREFLQSITAMTQRLTAFGNANPALMSVLGKLFATLAIGAVVIGGLGVIMLTILGPMALLKASLITLGLPTTLTPLSMVGAAFTKIKTILMALRIATLFNPITLGIMAIAAAALFIYAYWEPIKAFFSGLWTGISDGLAPIKQTMTDTFEAFKPIIEPLKPIIDALIGTVKELSSPLSFSAETMEKVSAVGKALGYAIGTLLFWIVDFIAAVIRGWALLLTSIPQIVSDLWNLVGSAWDNGINWIVNAWNNATATINTVLSQWINTIKTAWSGFIGGLVNGVTTLWTNIKSIFTNGVTALTTAATQLWTFISTAFTNGIMAVINFVRYFSTQLITVMQTAWSAVTTAATQLWVFISTVFTNGIMVVVNFVTGFGARLLSVMQAAWTALTNTVTQLWTQIKSLFSGGIGSLIATLLSFTPVGLFIQVFAAVWPYLSGLGEKFKQYGIDMLNGLKDGILGKAEAVIGSIMSVVNRVKGAFTGNKGMDINSPSRVFFKYAGFMMSGLGLGVDRFAKIPFRAMDKVTRFFRERPPIDLSVMMNTDSRVAQLAKAPLNLVSKVTEALGAQAFTVHAKVETDTSGIGKLWNAVKSMPLPSKLMRGLANYSPINMDTFTGAGRYIKRTGNSNDGITTQPPINLDRRRTVLPNAATMGSRGSSAAMSMGAITININGATDPQATAQMVRREMERLQRDNSARFRSRLSDID